MEVEFTARQVKISKQLRKQAEDGLERVARHLGKSAIASITFSEQKRLQIVELTIKARLLTIAAEGKADTLETALRLAIDHAENQAKRHRDRKLEKKRLPKEEKEAAAPPVTRSKTRAAAETEEKAKPVRGGAKPRKAVVEAHIVRSDDAIADNPMTLEEAVKETERNDRDLLIFHDKAGDVFVLHRNRNGEMELVELP